MVTDLSNLSGDGLTPDGLRRLLQQRPTRVATDPLPVLKTQRISRRLGDAVVGEIVAQYEAGESATKLAAKYDVAPSALLKLMRQMGVVVRTKGVPDSVADALAYEYQARVTVAVLEKRFNLSHGAVLRTLKRQGSVMRPTCRRAR